MDIYMKDVQGRPSPVTRQIPYLAQQIITMMVHYRCSLYIRLGIAPRTKDPHLFLIFGWREFVLSRVEAWESDWNENVGGACVDGDFAG